jgi:hypothetical protein
VVKKTVGEESRDSEPRESSHDQQGGDAAMTAESASDRQQQWVRIVRRSFGVPDLIPHAEARNALIGSLEDQLRENGWRSPTREIAEPMVDALMGLGAGEDVDDRLLPAADAAHRLLEKGTTVVDPQHLVFDMMSEYPPEVVAVAQQVLDRVGQYVREQPVGD